MTEINHSPEPWKPVTYDDGSIAVESADGHIVCIPKQARDLHVIAAAPTMLKGLRVLLDHFKQTPTDFEFNGKIVPKSYVIEYTELLIREATIGIDRA